jgi:phosphopentomutase
MKTRKFERVLLIVLDSAGCGALPDAAEYGDVGASTISNTASACGGLALPNMARLGLGNIVPIEGVAPAADPSGCFGKMASLSAGKDTTTGHWELAGIVLDEPFQVFPTGFPPEIIRAFEEETGRPVIGNEPASGTEIIMRLGAEQQRTGAWIVYTSADSVFQVAAHEEHIPLSELDRACRFARRLLDPYRVGRVISRPFVGPPGAYHRTYNRHDYSMRPHSPTLLDRLSEAALPVVGIGKIKSIFADRGVPVSFDTAGNDDGVRRALQALQEFPQGLIFCNLVDFDMRYGHRRDPAGYGAALEAFDHALPSLFEAAGHETLVVITADHGCDPTFTAHTDHTREYVPLLAWAQGLAGGDLGTRETFADLGQTVAWNFGVGPLAAGESFFTA